MTRFCRLRSIALFSFTTSILFNPLPDGHAWADENESDVLVLKAAELHVGDGTVLENGMVLVRDGKIAAVGANLVVPEGATVIELAGGAITPGLIDAAAMIETRDILTVSQRPRRGRGAEELLHNLFEGRNHVHVAGCCGSRCPRFLDHSTGDKCDVCGFPDAAPEMAVGTVRADVKVEESSEVIPHLREIDSWNPYSPDFGRLLGGGVTTVYMSPDSAAVISSQGAVVRTGGPLKQRVLREADAVKASMGTDPSWRGGRNQLPFRDSISFRARRPTTRMGVTWIFRKAFHDAERHARGLPVSGADTAEAAALLVLGQVRGGEIPLRIQARTHSDIISALRLTEEFGLSFILEEATEAYRCVEELKSRGTPVIYGPIFVYATGDRAWSAEVSRARLHTYQALIDGGVETALTARELREEDGLIRQAMYAKRFGASSEQIIRSVTQTPAKLLGLSDSLGTVETGKQADLVLWSGPPFEADSRAMVVLIEGQPVLDRRGL